MKKPNSIPTYQQAGEEKIRDNGFLVFKLSIKYKYGDMNDDRGL